MDSHNHVPTFAELGLDPKAASPEELDIAVEWCKNPKLREEFGNDFQCFCAGRLADQGKIGFPSSPASGSMHGRR